MADTAEHEIVRNPDTGRFELASAPEDAHLAYRQSGQHLTLVHTEVADELGGQGVASALVRGALDDAEANGWTVVPECDFVSGWLDRHPDRAARLTIEPPSA